MAQPELLRADVAETLESLTEDQKRQARITGLIFLAWLGKLANPDHYDGQTDSDGSIFFKNIVRWRREIDKLRGDSVPEADRWLSQADIPQEYQDKVKILSFAKPEIKQAMLRVSEIVQVLLQTGLNNPDNEDLILEYAEKIDFVMDEVRKTFVEEEKGHVVTVTLLRGGDRFQKRFSTENGSILRIDTKRLDMEKTNPEDENGEMNVGLGEWEGDGLQKLQELQKNGLKEIELQFADDCVASSSSLRAALALMKDMEQRGEIPKIKKVRVHAAVGEQTGIIELIKFAEELGIEIQVVVGVAAYQLAQNCYIERAPGEVDTAGKPFPDHAAFVYDMGAVLTKAREILKNRQKPAA